MISGVSRAVAVVVAYAVLAGPVAAELIEVKLAPGDAVEKRLSVAPGKFAELCSALQRGQAVLWQFRADAALDFNIHYHIDKQVEYPERRAGISEANGRLAPSVNQSYCWMWTNRSTRPIELDVRLNEPSR